MLIHQLASLVEAMWIVERFCRATERKSEEMGFDLRIYNPRLHMTDDNSKI
jgi:hypothetical protein